MRTLTGEVLQAVSLAVVTTNCEKYPGGQTLSRSHSGGEVPVMGMERRAEQSISQTRRTGVVSVENCIPAWICKARSLRRCTHSNKQQEISRFRANLHVRLLRHKVCHLLSWLNRRVPNGTHGGVRGRRSNDRLLLDCLLFTR